MMDPLITNAIDPALMRVLDKRGHDSDREPANRRRHPAVSGKLEEDRQEKGQDDQRQDQERQNQARLDEELKLEPDARKHLLDDMA
jgi:hypothetical protein